MSLDCTSRGVSGLLYTTSCPQTAHLEVCLVYYIWHHVPRLHIQRCVWFIIYSIMSLDCTSRGVFGLLYTASCPQTAHLEQCLVYYIQHHVPRLHIQRCVWFIIYSIMSLDYTSRGVYGLLYTASCPQTSHLEVCLVYYIQHHVPRLHIQRCVWFIIYSIMSLDYTSRGVSGLLYTASCPQTAHLEVCLVYYIQHHVPGLHIQRCVWFIIYSIMSLDCTSRGVSGLLYTTSCPQTAHLEVCLVYYIQHHLPRLPIQRCVWFIIYSIMSLDCTSRGVSGLLYTASCPWTTHLEVCLVYYIQHHVPRVHIQRCVGFIIYSIMSLDCISRGVSGLLYTASCPQTAHLEVCLVYYILHHLPGLHIQRCVWFTIYSIISLDCTSRGVSGLLYTASCPQTAHLEECLVYYIQHHVPRLHIQRCVWFIIYYIMSLDCTSRVVSGLLYTASSPQTAHLEVCLVYYIQHHVPRLHIQRCVWFIIYQHHVPGLHIQRCVWFIIYSIMSLDCTSRGVSGLLYTASCPWSTHLEVCLVYYIQHHVPRLHIQRCVWFIIYSIMSLDYISRGVSGLLYTASCPQTAHLEVCLVYYILHHVPRLHIQRCVWFIIYSIISLDCPSRGVFGLLYTASCPQTAHLKVCLVYYIQHHVPGPHIQRCVWFIIYSIMFLDCTSRGVSGLLYTASCPQTAHLEVCLVYYIQRHVPRLHIQRCVWFIIYYIISLDCTSRGVSGLLYTASSPWTAHLEVCLVYYIQHHVSRLHIQKSVWFIIYSIMSLDCTSRGVSGLLYTTSCPQTAHLELCLVYYIQHHLPRLHIQRCVWFIIYSIMSLDCTSRGVSGLLYTASCPWSTHLEVCLVYYIQHHVPRLHIQRCVWFIIYYIMSLDCTSRGVSGLLYTPS